jgi:hypothetical protein
VDFDSGGVLAAERQPCGAEADFHRIAQWGEADNFDLFTFEHAHVEESLDQRRIALKRKDAAPLTGPELVESRHVVTP